MTIDSSCCTSSCEGEDGYSYSAGCGSSPSCSFSLPASSLSVTYHVSWAVFGGGGVR